MSACGHRRPPTFRSVCISPPFRLHLTLCAAHYHTLWAVSRISGTLPYIVHGAMRALCVKADAELAACETAPAGLGPRPHIDKRAEHVVHCAVHELRLCPPTRQPM